MTSPSPDAQFQRDYLPFGGARGNALLFSPAPRRAAPEHGILKGEALERGAGQSPAVSPARSARAWDSKETMSPLAGRRSTPYCFPPPLPGAQRRSMGFSRAKPLSGARGRAPPSPRAQCQSMGFQRDNIPFGGTQVNALLFPSPVPRRAAPEHGILKGEALERGAGQSPAVSPRSPRTKKAPGNSDA